MKKRKRGDKRNYLFLREIATTAATENKRTATSNPGVPEVVVVVVVVVVSTGGSVVVVV